VAIGESINSVAPLPDAVVDRGFSPNASLSAPTMGKGRF